MNKLFNISETNFEGLGKLSLDSVFALELIVNGAIPETSKTSSLAQGLVRKGYINEDLSITALGRELYEGLLGGKADVKIKKLAMSKQGLIGIHKKLEDKIVRLTGGNQIRPSIGGKKYAFLCNDVDLVNKLSKVIVKYKLTDFQKIEDTLLSYIEQCCNTKTFFPLVTYYIHKRKDDGTEESQLVTDMSNERIMPMKQINSDI